MSSATTAVPSVDEVRRAVDEIPLWYHTIDLPHGVTTPGWFDLRPVLDRMPWPDLAGKRCLDVGTWDGHLAFEMERRGASEVVAIDLEDHTRWDVPIRGRAAVARSLGAINGSEKGAGFRAARAALGSSVDRRTISVYDLDPDEVGTFDVVTCGSLMLHLRDPIRALEAIRSVSREWFVSAETIRLRATALHPRRPVAVLEADAGLGQWWLPNLAAHRRMLWAAGFRTVRQTRPYPVRLGPAHPAPVSTRDRALAAGRRALLGAEGVPHVALLARADAYDGAPRI